MNREKIRIYIANRLFSYPIYEDKEQIYVPMLTGAEKFEKEGRQIPDGYQRDDELEHISQKNETYAEFTGQYWVWKNVKADIVGFIQYRRYFVSEEFECAIQKNSFQLGSSRIYKPFCNHIDPYQYILDKDYIENMLEKYDLCVKINKEIPICDLIESYGKDFSEKLVQVMQELYPEYLPDLEIAMRDSVNYHCNMYIGKKTILDQYWAWIFPILERLESLDMQFRFETDMYDKRFAYVGEVLLKVWIDHNNISCKVQDTVVLQRYRAEILSPAISSFYELPKLICRHMKAEYKKKHHVMEEWHDRMYRKSVAVTGASGFLGKSFCRKLAFSGAEVYAIVRNSNSDISELQGIENIHIIVCDLDEIQRLCDLILEKVDYFYHFGWEGTSGEKRTNERIQLKNVERTCDAVRVASQLGCEKFIFASSIMEFETEKRITGNNKLALSDIYSLCKRNAEQLGRVVAENAEIGYVCALISNIYGPGEKSERLINSSIRKILKNEETAFSSGKQLYDFIYIDDAIEFLKAIGIQGKPGKTYYVGNETPKKLQEFLQILGEEACPGRDIGIGRLQESVDGLTYREFDTKLARKELGVSCKVSFREGIRRTIDYIQKEPT